MSIARKLRWAAVIVIVLLATAGGILYVQASRTPHDYRPPQLTAEQKDAGVHEFVDGLVFRDFNNKAEANEQFTISLTEEQLNTYIACAEQIAQTLGRGGDVSRFMERSGLEDPAVALHKDVLKLMVRQKSSGKIVSASVGFDFVPDGKMLIRLTDVSVGSLPIPDSVVHSKLDEIKQKLPPAASQPAHHTRSSSQSVVEGLSTALNLLVLAMNEEPIPTEIYSPVNKRPVIIDAIKIEEGRITLNVRPVRRKTPG